MCLYIIIAFSLNGYVLLTQFPEFPHLLMRHIIKSTSEITALQATDRSMFTASMDIDRFIIQLSTRIAAEKSSETNSRTGRVTGDDDKYHDYRLQLFNPAYARNWIRLRAIEHHSYRSIQRDHQSENQPSMARSYPWISFLRNQRRSWKWIASQHSCDCFPPNWAKCIDFNCRVRLQLYQPRRSPEDSKNKKGNWINSNHPDPGK